MPAVSSILLKLSLYFSLLRRPIAIQEVLRESGLALWLDLDYRLTFSDLSSWIDRQALHQIYTDWNRIRIGLGHWIRIQEGKNNDPQKLKKVKKFHVLKCWMFSFEGRRLRRPRDNK
jgi:hypothetical protein